MGPSAPHHASTDGVDDIEGYADYVEPQTANFGEFVLVGDSFAAVVAPAVAARQPAGLRGSSRVKVRLAL